MLTGTAVEEIRARLGELSPDFWTAAEVLRALNEGVSRFSAQERWPWLFTEVTNVALGSGTATLDLQEGVSLARHFNLLVSFSGDPRPRAVRRVSAVEGHRLRLTEYTDRSEPMAFYLVSEADADNDGQFITKLRFVPAMNRASTIAYQYIRDPDSVSADADALDVPEEYAMGPIAYATGLLWLKELRDSRKADEQFTLFATVVDDAKRELRKLTPDSGFAWGRNEPEPYAPTSESDEVYRHFTGPLGP